MPIVDDNRLKGNFGASYVAACLSSECLVRPVTNDTDVGIDLYCETVADNRPFLHFWVQVKAGDQCRLLEDGSKAYCTFSTDHLKYWNRQPIPVFAALVPTGWPVKDDPNVYVIDLVSQLLGGLPAGQHTHTLYSDFTWERGNGQHIKDFLELAVPRSAARLLCRSGVIAATPTPEPSYEKKVPLVPVSRFQKEISDQLRRTAANSILFLFNTGEFGPETDTFRHIMAGIVEQCSDDQHWENYMARAISYHVDREFDAAAELYRQAIRSIQCDKKVSDKPNWIRIRKEVEILLGRATNKLGIKDAD
jgi:hypothetical protein